MTKLKDLIDPQTKATLEQGAAIKIPLTLSVENNKKANNRKHPDYAYYGFPPELSGKRFKIDHIGNDWFTVKEYVLPEGRVRMHGVSRLDAEGTTMRLRYGAKSFLQVGRIFQKGTIEAKMHLVNGKIVFKIPFKLSDEKLEQKKTSNAPRNLQVRDKKVALKIAINNVNYALMNDPDLQPEIVDGKLRVYKVTRTEIA